MAKPGKKIQPPVNVDTSNIGDQSLLELFKNIQLVWGKAYEPEKTGFNIRSKKFNAFKKQSGLKIIIKKQDEIQSCANHEGFFDFQKAQNIFIFNSTNSQAYDLLRHLRNSIAHGTFKKERIAGKVYLSFTDSYRKKYTMLGRIEFSLLTQFIEALYATKKPKNTNKKRKIK